MADELLTPMELVKRWKGSVSVTTLKQWRYLGKGPKYVKIGQSVRYRIEDIETWEKENSNG